MPEPISSHSVPAPHAPPWMLLILSGVTGMILMALVFLMTFGKPSVPTPTPEPNPTATSTEPGTTSTTQAALLTPSTSSTLDVAWQPATLVNPNTAFHGAFPATLHRNEMIDTGAGPTTTTLEQTYAYYDRGKVKSGPYAGITVYQAVVSGDRVSGQDGPGDWFGPQAFFFLAQQQGTSTNVFVLNPTRFFEETGAVVVPTLAIEKYTFPETVTLENGKTLFRSPMPTENGWGTNLGGNVDPRCTPTGCPDREAAATTTNHEKLYTQVQMDGQSLNVDRPGCLTMYSPAGEPRVYLSMIATQDVDETKSSDTLKVPGIASTHIAWKAGYSGRGTFNPFEVTGCGGMNCLAIEPDSGMVVGRDLVQVGTVNGTDPIYFPIHPTENPVVQRTYEGWFDYEIDKDYAKKPPIATFLKRYPVPLFFWKDALGRWVTYQSNKILPMAECGKPVIYLYPEKTEMVHVSLPASVKVTVSEPTYPKNGWTVSADPSGTLTSPDGSKSSSLYWEGTGISYAVPTTGFVVRNSDVSSFLKTTLAKYGLNTQETKEFMDFWVPKMVGAPYYRVSFLTHAWSNAAPLNIQPTPDTNIRLFMDWEKLAGPIDLPAPSISAPARKGFTLVEWGGLLQK